MKVLVLVECEPDPQGTGQDREVCSLLVRFGSSADVRCLALGPSSSSKVARALLARQGVRLIREPEGDVARLRRRLLQACRQERFDSIVVVGAGPCCDWLKTLRLAVPSAFLAALLPDAARLLEDLAGRPDAARARGAQAWRNLFSLADALWCVEPRDLARLRAALGPLRTALSLAPARGASPAWRRARAARALSLLAPEPVQRERLRGLLLRQTGRAVELPARLSRDPSLAETNRALAAVRGGDVLVCLHAFEPESGVLGALLELFNLLPYAGIAAPLTARAAQARARRAHFTAAWALQHKGSWREVDFPPHLCCALVRSEALEAAGLLDERFLEPFAAWVDLFLRIGQAGYATFLAEDALAFCAGPRALRSGASRYAPRDRDLLVEKWCRQGLRFMESLLTSSEPEGYRLPSAQERETAGV